MDKNKLFVLYSDCVVVKASSNYYIFDLSRHNYYPITAEVFTLLNNLKLSNYDDLLLQYNSDSRDNILALVNQLVENELAFFTYDLTRFPKINFNYHEPPFFISNAIVEFSSRSSYDIREVLSILLKLNCKYIQIRILDGIEGDFLIQLLELFNNSIVKGIELKLNYFENFNEDYIKNLIVKFKRISSISLFNCLKNDRIKYAEHDKIGRIQYVNFKLLKSHPDQVSINNFSLNLSTYIEGLNRNIGLNHKICISDEGLIKNYLDHSRDFGLISNSSFGVKIA